MGKKEPKSKTPPPVADESAAGLARATSRDSLCIESLPKDVRELYEIHEWRHACAVLKNDFPEEFRAIERFAKMSRH